MTSEEEEWSRFVTGGYGRHRSQWVETCSARSFIYDSMIVRENMHGLSSHKERFIKDQVKHWMTGDIMGEDPSLRKNLYDVVSPQEKLSFLTNL